MRVHVDDYDLLRSPGRTRLCWPGLAFYSDIFGLGESTRSMAIRFASYGFVVVAPELYWRLEPAGTVFAFDDIGRERGLERARATSLAEFDDDIAAVRHHLLARSDVIPKLLGAVGVCLGGHLAFRAAFTPEIGATACFYPTGLHDGALGKDVADSLDRDPHVTSFDAEHAFMRGVGARYDAFRASRVSAHHGAYAL